MADIRYSYADVPTIERFALSEKRWRGLMGPFGSGKSSGCVIEILKRGVAQLPDNDGIRRSRWAVVRNSYPQLKDTTIPTFFDWLPPIHFGEYLKADHTYIMRPRQDVLIEVRFRALDRPDQVSNLLSSEYTGAWINEAREVPWSIIEMLDDRCDRYPSLLKGPGATWAGIIMDTNPPDDDSNWYKFFEEKRPDNAAIFKQPSGLSEEAENLSALKRGRGYYENMVKTKNSDYIKVYAHGEYGYVQDGRPIFPEYNDSVHCAPSLIEPIKGVPIRRGFDFGLTPSTVFSQMTPSGQFVVFDEVNSTRAGIDSHSSNILSYCATKFPGFSYIDDGDPAGQRGVETDERTCFDILRAKGFNIQPGIQTPSIRLESVRKALTTMIDGKPGFLLSPACKLLRKGFLGRYRYRRMKMANEQYADRPEKNYVSHPHDALQYTATNLFRSALLTSTKKWEPLTYPKVRFL